VNYDRAPCLILRTLSTPKSYSELSTFTLCFFAYLCTTITPVSQGVPQVASYSVSIINQANQPTMNTDRLY